MRRSPETASVREGASARISSIDSRANGTLLVTRTPADVAGPGCLVPSIDRKAKTLTVRWYATHNGFGRGG